MTQTTKPPRLVILLNDGIIQNVYHDTSAVEYIIVDMDVEGFDIDRIATDIDGDEYLKAYPQLTMPTRNNYVKEIFDRAAAGYPEPSPKPHPHAGVIHAWAEGAEVEVLDPDTKEWLPSTKPEWHAELQYRVRGTNSAPNPRSQDPAWVQHDGGPIPMAVTPPRPEFELLFRDGGTTVTDEPDVFDWTHTDDPKDIVAYRAIQVSRSMQNPEARVVATIGEVIDRPQLTPTEDKQMSWVPLDPGYPE